MSGSLFLDDKDSAKVCISICQEAFSKSTTDERFGLGGARQK
jgi:hypothetical protein